VLRQSLAAAAAAGAGTHLLPGHYDVDLPEDLDRLRAELSEAGSEAARLAPHTRRALSELA
jgi:hypothetical protein